MSTGKETKRNNNASSQMPTVGCCFLHHFLYSVFIHYFLMWKSQILINQSIERQIHSAYTVIYNELLLMKNSRLYQNVI